jgi:rhamnulokinase
VTSPEGLRWDAAALRGEVLEGLRLAARAGSDLASIAIDSWGVDYGLLDGEGALVADPFHYRDERTTVSVERMQAVAPHDWLFARDGLQFLPFNTLYQLVAEPPSRLEAARTIALIPDLVGHWLTGLAVAERTNASTTGLLDARSGEWSWEIVDRIGLSRTLLPELHDPGDRLGPVTAEVAAAIGLRRGTEVTHVGSHDTASAVVGVPAEGDRFAYISCGTWGLVGVELAGPILTDDARIAGFTNERGVDGRIRFLRNVSGLWLLQESLRTWSEAGAAEDLDALLAAAAAEPAGGPVFDPEDPVFLPPGDMPARISAALEASGRPVPPTRPGLVRSILASRALAFARAVDDVVRLSGRAIDTIHLVGGGARNELLCRLTADASGRVVVAGPVEATALGNILVQARTQGWIEGDLDAMRARVRASQELRRYEPTGRGAGVATGRRP